MEYLLNFIKKKKEKDIKDKKEEELTLEDRLQLVQNSKATDSSIFETLLKIKDTSECSVTVSERAYNDLEFFMDNNNTEENSVYKKINSTNTELGNIYLKHILANPTHNVTKLHKRQTVQKMYNKLDRNSIEAISKSLSIINSLESDIAWFWNSNNKKHLEVFNNIIFLNYTGIQKIDGMLNSKEVLLSINNIYKIFLAPVIAILTPLSAMVVPIVLFLLFRKKLPFKLSMKNFFSLVVNTFMNFFKSNIFRFFVKDPKKAKMLGFVSTAIWVVMYLQSIYSSFTLSRTINKIINMIHLKMNSVCQLVNESCKIMDICKDIQLAEYFEIDIPTVCNEIECIKKTVDADIFKCQPKLFDNKGRILCRFCIFEKLKNKTVDILRFIGLVDTLNSNHELINNGFTMTKFCSNEKPVIKCKDIRNPYLNSNAICNTVNINKNIIITGPNAAGKSTFIKSIAINLLLSQTIGLCSAKTLEITPFKIVDTYLHIPDVTGTSSLFEAEMIRSKEYVDKIKECDDFSFVIMDELFSSTNHVEGFSGAYAILNKMAQYEKSLFMVTTHYTKLSGLEKENKDHIANYKFEVDRDLSGNIKFNYILKRGFSKQFIALELLKNNGFDEDIIEKAMIVSKKLLKTKKSK